MSATAFFFYFIFKNVFIYHLIFPILFIQFFFSKATEKTKELLTGFLFIQVFKT